MFDDGREEPFGDCSFCPAFSRCLNDVAYCGITDEEIGCRLERRVSPTDHRGCYVMCFDRPDWCPLEEVLDG